MIIDSHAQFGPSLRDGRDRFGALWPIAEAWQLIELMDQAGIDQSVAFAPAWCGGDDFFDPEYRQANDIVFDGAVRYPDRLIGFARVAPRYGADAVRELDRCFREFDAAGLMLDPEADAFNPMDERLMIPLMERCAERCSVVLFKCGFPPAQPGPILPLAERFPAVRFILAHTSLRIGADAAIMARRCANIYLETSLQTLSVYKAIISSLDASRILFGSCTPFGIAKAEIRKVAALPSITPAQREAILGGNLKRLLSSRSNQSAGVKSH